MHARVQTLLILAVLSLAGLGLPAPANEIPAQLPDPDGKPGDAAQPVQVYILAGQSNMVGMGDISGAKNRFQGVYLTADPAAPTGPLYINGAGLFRIRPLDVRQSAEEDAAPGGIASLYPGAYDPDTDYEQAQPAESQPVPLGETAGSLPALSSPHTVVVRGFLEVPESGSYTLHAGYRGSSYNVAQLDGKQVYRRDPGGQPAKQKVALQAGKPYPLTITYFQGGSTALWMSEEDLLGKGDLEAVAKREGKFPWLVDERGEWTVRNDVWYQEARIAKDGKGSPLSPTSNGRSIGPELGFGHVLGTFHDGQVLLIKTAMGNRALGWDFRPPSSGRTEGEGADKWEGLEYRLMIEGVRKTLQNIQNIVPGYQGQGYEIAGFVWWQGHKDGGLPGMGAEYEQNLVNLIQDVRQEFKSPRLPAAVATVGFGGHNMNEKYLQILAAQLAVSDPDKHPELAGTVASVDTRDFWREVDDSPVSQDYHYNRNAETYLRVGDALGRAMVRLKGGQAQQLPAPSGSRAAAKTSASAPDAAEPDEAAVAAGRAALKPVILDGMLARHLADERTLAAVQLALSGERPPRSSQFLRDATFAVAELYRAAGVHDYDWRRFGPDLDSMKWDYFSFDPPEQQPKDKPNRYREVTYPEGMGDWFAVDFDPAAAGWKQGRQPFGQLGGQLLPLRESCTLPFCGCGDAPRTLWDKEVLLMRTTVDVPPLQDGNRYRVVVGGSAHVAAGEGFALYVNGKLLAQSPVGVGRRQGAQPRGGQIYNDFRDELSGEQLTIAATSFLRYHHPRQGVIPPRGHLSIWLEEMKSPPLPATD